MGCRALELVRGTGERQSGHFRHPAGEEFGKSRGTVEPCTDGGAPLRQGVDILETGIDAALSERDLLCETRELLPECQRRGVLQVGTPDLVDARPVPAFCLEDCLHCVQGRQQAGVRLLRRGDVHGAGKAVVGGLPAVAVIVGVHGLLAAELAAQELAGSIGDHLIGIHVGLCAGTGLPDGNGEVIVPVAPHDFTRCRGQCLGDFRRQLAEFTVAAGGTVFDCAQSAGQRYRHCRAADSEIADGALGLRAPIAI